MISYPDYCEDDSYVYKQFVEPAILYQTNYNKVPVLPYILNYFENDKKRMINLGLNAYIGLAKLANHPIENKYDKMWRIWCKNYNHKQIGKEEGTWGFHAHLGKQAELLSNTYGCDFGQYWLNFVRIYLSTAEGKKESKVKQSIIDTSYSIFESEINFLDETNKLPHIVLVYGNKVWDYGIIPFACNNIEKFSYKRKFRFCIITSKKSGHVTAFCRLSHPAAYKKKSFYDVKKLIVNYQSDIQNILNQP